MPDLPDAGIDLCQFFPDAGFAPCQVFPDAGFALSQMFPDAGFPLCGSAPWRANATARAAAFPACVQESGMLRICCRGAESGRHICAVHSRAHHARRCTVVVHSCAVHSRAHHARRCTVVVHSCAVPGRVRVYLKAQDAHASTHARMPACTHARTCAFTRAHRHTRSHTCRPAPFLCECSTDKSSAGASSPTYRRHRSSTTRAHDASLPLLMD
eukprot:354798-Chlamydomonas_euryale.AAC.5